MGRECYICGKNYYDKSTLNKHIRQSHGNKLQVTNESCKIPSNVFPHSNGIIKDAKRMILIDENEYYMLQKSSWKQLPDDRLKSGLYDKSKLDLSIDSIPDDLKAKQLQHDFIRFQLARLKLPDNDPNPPILPEIETLDEDKPIIKKEKKTYEKSKRKVRKLVKWETMN
jgi:hypothetical protein